MAQQPVLPLLLVLLLNSACASSAAAAGSEQLHHCGAQQDRDNFLELLNYQRALHGAQPLVWDDRLASTAQAWAEMCPKPFEHSDWRNFGGDRFCETAVVTSGAFARYPTPSGLMPCTEATLLFYDEVHNFNWSWSRQRFTEFPPASLPLHETAGTTTHFTATVWAASERVGCGVTRCPGGDVHTVCHYAPGGNFFECSPTGPDGRPDCNSFVKNVLTTACQNATGNLGCAECSGAACTACYRGWGKQPDAAGRCDPNVFTP